MLTLFLVNSAFNAGGAGFWLLTFERNIAFLAKLHFVTVILEIILFAFFSLTQFGQGTQTKHHKEASNPSKGDNKEKE